MAEIDQTWHFFIAHGTPDTASAEALYDLLSPDYRVFLDTRCLLPGDEWDLAIARAQRASQVTTVLVSPGYDSRYYLRDEIHSAVALRRQEGSTHRVVPVFLKGWPSDASDIPYGLRLPQAIDAVKVGGIPGVAAELRKLATHLAGTPITPAPVVPPTRYTADDVFDAISRMLGAQFDELLFRFRAPVNQLAPPTAPLKTRAVDLIYFAEQSGDGLDRLAAAVRKVAPHLLPG